MDNRFTLALKYYESGLGDQAWALVNEMVAEADPEHDVLKLDGGLHDAINAFMGTTAALATDPGTVQLQVPQGYGRSIVDLVTLARLVREKRERGADPLISQLLDEIELRAEVELAKLARR